MPAHHDAHAPTSAHPAHDGTADVDLAELLDLDGEVLRSYWTDVMTWVQDATIGSDPGRILDLGAGTGTGAIALAQRFGGSEVIAVDVSGDMLSRLRVKVLAEGLAHRIRTVQADLDVAWPVLGPIDVTWASMSLHHMSNPDRVLDDLFAATRPGGLVAVAEISESLRFLPHDVGFGRPGLEERCLDALSEEHALSVPELGSAWGPRLEAAGFAVLSERTFAIELNAPHPAATARYAQLWFRRLKVALTDRLASEDLEALATLIDGDGPESLQRRGDLQVRGFRTGTIARRPSHVSTQSACTQGRRAMPEIAFS